jgi:hypothetical protein
LNEINRLTFAFWSRYSHVGIAGIAARSGLDSRQGKIFFLHGIQTGCAIKYKPDTQNIVLGITFDTVEAGGKLHISDSRFSE